MVGHRVVQVAGQMFTLLARSSSTFAVRAPARKRIATPSTIVIRKMTTPVTVSLAALKSKTEWTMTGTDIIIRPISACRPEAQRNSAYGKNNTDPDV